MERREQYFLLHDQLDVLLSILQAKDFTCIGPQVRQNTIIFDEIKNASELPWGYIDHQKPGSYKLEKTSATLAFAWANGPQAIKPFIFKAYDKVWDVKLGDKGELEFVYSKENPPKIAFIGARPCDLAALKIQDMLFLEGKYIDYYYKARRENFLIIAVNCTRCSDNCFCYSTGDGPKATDYCDIALTEQKEGFLVEVITDQGQEVIAKLNLPYANENLIKQVDACLIEAASKQTKKLPAKNLRQCLFSNLEHPRWDDVASRCLSCTNCTQVCPTCFCQYMIEHPDIDGKTSQRVKAWDSCFTRGHSYIHGNVIRDDTRKRYRQWLTHKIGSWHDQFGRSGCVGCGRCITWCPVGIDITEEANAICGKKEDSDINSD